MPFKKDVKIAHPEALMLERRVMEMRRDGKSFREISDALDLSGSSRASEVFKRAIHRYTKDIGPEAKQLEELRLDELHKAVWDQALLGDLKAVETVLKIMERRARLLGLDHNDKMAAQRAKIEADKVKVMAMALGKALDAINLDERRKEQATEVMFAEMKQLAGEDTIQEVQQETTAPPEQGSGSPERSEACGQHGDDCDG